MSLKGKKVMIADAGDLSYALTWQFAKAGADVFWYCDWDQSWPEAGEAAVGAGFEHVEHVTDLWLRAKEMDLFVFPNLGFVGEQKQLIAMGKRVWGSGPGQILEMNRERLRHVQTEAGMDVPTFKVFPGLARLDAHLRTVQNKWIKVSKWRADMETWRHFDYDRSIPMLNKLRSKLGELGEQIRFLIEDDIPTTLETGADCINVRGAFGDHGCIGMERKNRGCLSRLFPYEQMPQEVRDVNDGLTASLKAMYHAQFISTEIRVKGNKRFLIDITTRMAFPCGTCFLNLVGNIADVMFEGAAGNLIAMEPADKYACEAVISHDEEDFKTTVRRVKFPDAVLPYLHLIAPIAGASTIDFHPVTYSSRVIGSVVGTGKTVKAAHESMMKRVELIKDNPIDVDTACMIDLVREAEESEEKGIEFADEELPAVEEVLD